MRWLSINQKVNEAEQILLKMARRNGKKVTDKQKVIISEAVKKISASNDVEKRKLNPTDMFR